MKKLLTATNLTIPSRSGKQSVTNSIA